MKCIKYNYSIDGDILNYEALLRLSDDKTEITILRKESAEEKKFVLEADASVVNELRSKLAKRK